MQDNHETDTDRVPGLSEAGGIGAAFRSRGNRRIKTELVIFIRPRVIRTPSVGEDFQDFRPWLPANIEAAQPLPRVGERPPGGDEP